MRITYLLAVGAWPAIVLSLLVIVTGYFKMCKHNAKTYTVIMEGPMRLRRRYFVVLFGSIAYLLWYYRIIV